VFNTYLQLSLRRDGFFKPIDQGNLLALPFLNPRLVGVDHRSGSGVDDPIQQVLDLRLHPLSCFR